MVDCLRHLKFGVIMDSLSLWFRNEIIRNLILFLLIQINWLFLIQILITSVLRLKNNNIVENVRGLLNLLFFLAWIQYWLQNFARSTLISLLCHLILALSSCDSFLLLNRRCLILVKNLLSTFWCHSIILAIIRIYSPKMVFIKIRPIHWIAIYWISKCWVLRLMRFESKINYLVRLIFWATVSILINLNAFSSNWRFNLNCLRSLPFKYFNFST